MALCRNVWRDTGVAFDSDGDARRRIAVDMLKIENSSEIQSGGAFTGASQNFSYWSYHKLSALARRLASTNHAAYLLLKLCRMQNT